MITSLNVTGLILSAGLSGRIKTFKPLAEFKGKSFIHNIIEKLSTVCGQIVIVTGFNSDYLRKEIIKSLVSNNQSEINTRLRFVHNESYEEGMFTSLQQGISVINNTDWILYHFTDQPGLPENFYSVFINQIDSDYNWIQPVNKGKPGHPILIRNELFELITKASPDSSLRSISKSPQVKKKYWICDYKEIFQDIDTDEDYSKLQQ